MMVRMGDWLQEQASRGHLTRGQVEAAGLWASDLAELGSELRSNRMDREFRSERPADIMRVAIAQRVQAACAKLGGKGSPFYQAVHAVAVSGQTAGEVGEAMGIRTTSAMDLIRLSLNDLMTVYQLR